MGGARTALRPPGPDQLGDLLHPVHQQRHAAVGGEDRDVDGAPVPLLPHSGAFGVLHVVALQGHGVALPGGHDPLE